MLYFILYIFQLKVSVYIGDVYKMIWVFEGTLQKIIRKHSRLFLELFLVIYLFLELIYLRRNIQIREE